MTILLYDHRGLEERTSRSLKVWKAWHLILYVMAAISGIMNYIFLRNTMDLVNGNCVLYPRELEFRWYDIPIEENGHMMGIAVTNTDEDVTTTEVAQADDTTVPNRSSESFKDRTIREINNGTFEDTTEINNVTMETANQTHRWMLDPMRTLFEDDASCEFAEYMPVMSTVFAAVWATMFTMCAGGGRVRTGLPQPWRILAPALIFSLVMVGLTGHSFTLTNGGLHDFCAQFYEYSNSTTCSAANSFLESSWNASWGLGGRVGATRAASAGVWASWACAAALLLARCLVAPDFEVKRTGVYLVKDPLQEVTPYLKKSQKPKSKSPNSSPTKQDRLSIKSEPTNMTELVTASIEQDQDSIPPSLMATPINHQRNSDMIEMTYTPRERMTEL